MSVKDVIIWLLKGAFGFIRQVAEGLSQGITEIQQQAPRLTMGDFKESVYTNHFEGFLDCDQSFDDREFGKRIREFIG